MGIGRREFLRLFATGLAVASPTAAIAIADDQYINRRLGIAFEKPSGWIFADVKQMEDVKAGQILGVEDLELMQSIVETTEVPILAISRDGISADSTKFTPGINVYLDRFSAEEECDPLALTPAETLESDSESCAHVLKDFQAVSPVTTSRVSECNAAQYDAVFLFEHENMKPTPVRMRTLVIDQATAFYTIRMYDSPFAGDPMIFDYSSFIASIRMV